MTAIIISALRRVAYIPSPHGFGWTVDDEGLHITWMTHTHGHKCFSRVTLGVSAHYTHSETLYLVLKHLLFRVEISIETRAETLP